MLRRENDEIQQLRSQIKELAKDVDSLKLQLKVYMAKSIISDTQTDNSENAFAKSIGKVAGNVVLGNDIKYYGHNKHMLNQLVKTFNHMFSNSNATASFSTTTYQSNYQQAQNFKNMSYKL